MTLLDESLHGRMLFAIPKKGRLYERCLELLKGADIQFTRSARLDVALVRNLPMALVFLPAADIPRFVGEGNIDLGITGQDMVAESEVETALIKESLALNFGKCKLQIQVPERSGYSTPEDVLGKKIATSFENVSGQFFGDLDRKNQTKTVIEYVGGSVEAACALGLADAIVDLVESGDTMRAAGLKAIHTILSSQAVMIQSVTPKSKDHLPLIGLITSRIAGVLAAEKYYSCVYNIERRLLSEACKITPGRRAPTVTNLEESAVYGSSSSNADSQANGVRTPSDWVAVNVMVEQADSAQVMDRLQELGAHDIYLMEIKNCRV